MPKIFLLNCLPGGGRGGRGGPRQRPKGAKGTAAAAALPICDQCWSIFCCFAPCTQTPRNTCRLSSRCCWRCNDGKLSPVARRRIHSGVHRSHLYWGRRTVLASLSKTFSYLMDHFLVLHLFCSHSELCTEVGFEFLTSFLSQSSRQTMQCEYSTISS